MNIIAQDNMLVYVSKVILRCKVMGLKMISNKMNRAQRETALSLVVILKMKTGWYSIHHECNSKKHVA